VFEYNTTANAQHLVVEAVVVQMEGLTVTTQLQIRGLPALLHSSVRKVPVLIKPQCMLLRNLGYPFKTSVQMPLGQQIFSAH
jgi:hypothetical protein